MKTEAFKKAGNCKRSIWQSLADKSTSNQKGVQNQTAGMCIKIMTGDQITATKKGRIKYYQIWYGGKIYRMSKKEVGINTFAISNRFHTESQNRKCELDDYLVPRPRLIIRAKKKFF